jgi:hypothetical protein
MEIVLLSRRQAKSGRVKEIFIRTGWGVFLIKKNWKLTTRLLGAQEKYAFANTSSPAPREMSLPAAVPPRIRVAEPRALPWASQTEQRYMANQHTSLIFTAVGSCKAEMSRPASQSSSFRPFIHGRRIGSGGSCRPSVIRSIPKHWRANLWQGGEG